MKCPVCDNVNESMVCVRCGFDSSRDYEKYPTFGPVGRVPSASGLRAEWKGPVKQPLKVPVWLMAAACVLTMILGIWIGTGIHKPDPTEPGESTQMQEPMETTVPCQGIVMQEAVLHLETLGEQKQLTVLAVPTDTTDVLTFVSADPAVAEVDDMGIVTAVGPGQTTITITCGDQLKTCNVVCWHQTETTDPVVPTDPSKPTDPVEPTEPTKPADQAVLKLDKEDVSCYYAGETFRLSVKLGSSSVSRSEATWSTSDPKVATVENGKVIAVGKGEATITAEYNGQKATCIVRCKNATPENDEVDQPAASDWKVRPADDVGIVIGETFRLRVINSAGEEADVIWTVSEEGIISISGTKVTARSVGTVKLKTEIDGVTLTCTVRVSR